jgi:hypothetical protein
LKLFQKMCDIKAEGRRIPSSAVPANFWHPEVSRRRQERGTHSATAAEISEWIAAFASEAGIESEVDIESEFKKLEELLPAQEPKKGRK